MRYRDLRWPCDHPVVLLRGEVGIGGRILNISTSGARLRVADPLAQGARVFLDLHDGPIGAEVRWSRGDLVGLRFDRLLTPREVGVARKALTLVRRGTGWSGQFRELT